ncbi:MAG: hypothetical protein IPK26_31755 [Planctomycetes bacterium]|nr:hypothetical protein [Planctomycetota bacterium]
MADEPEIPTTPIRWRWLGVALLLWIGCAHLAPRHGWRRDLGPVVPHDRFPADCTLCHVGGDWRTLRTDFQFDHEQQTGVPLHGAHTTASCLLCHNDRGPVAQFAARGCRGCHVDPHQAQLGNDCATCHGESNWRPSAAIALHDRTRFPLVGAHAAAACFRCHAGAQVGNFAGASSACVHCHGQDLVRATSPDHAANGWIGDCQRCHTPLAFAPARFEHTASFPLVQGHGGRRCADCHTNGTFAGLSTTCFACHDDDYAAARDPQHVPPTFPTTCENCHSIATFRGARFDHAANFALTGGHAIACSRCHTAPGTYAGLTPTCSSCHADEWSATTGPAHAAAGFPMTCQDCHSTLSWRPANFTHPATMPLTGAHALTCASCHTTPGTYTGLSANCASCHDPDYRAATNPPHAGIGMPTACQQCHGTTAWRPATFTHRFPTTRDHAVGCAECHREPTNVAVFSCTHCHDHRETEMADKHRRVNGYQWLSSACYQCHPQGRE